MLFINDLLGRRKQWNKICLLTNVSLTVSVRFIKFSSLIGEKPHPV